MKRSLYRIILLVMVLSLSLSLPGMNGSVKALAPVTFTILHTNDFHGQLEESGSNPGSARLATIVKDVRTAKGTDKVLLVDGGDEMQGSLLSNMQRGKPVIGVYNLLGYNVATFGNHEFDWGQTDLAARTTEATYPYVTANIVKKDAGTCDASGWTKPDFADAPYTVVTVNGVKVAFIGVTTTEVPTITLAANTNGLCFKDPYESIVHYYDAMKAESDVMVVLSHLGLPDGGYGYGIPVIGDKTLADKLIKAGKPVAMIIGGHSHTNMTAAEVVTSADKSVSTTVAQAYYNGRAVGEADFTFDPATKAVTVAWKKLTVYPGSVKLPDVPTPVDDATKAKVAEYASDPIYQEKISQPIGYVQTDLLRDYNGDNMMGNFIDDAIYNQLNSDGNSANDVDLFLNNAGGIRIEWCDAPDPKDATKYVWTSDPKLCQKSGLWQHSPMLLNYGQMFQILPFGNATVVGEMTGAQILMVLNQSATLGKGAIQPAGLKYSFYRYSDTKPGPQPYAWGAFDACVINKTTQACEPLDMKKTYKVGTNEFLAPAGGDNYAGFKYMTNITYWGDMLDAVNAYVTATYTEAAPYMGPKGTGELDGRITRVGTDTYDAAVPGAIVPITVLHHNDSHGNLAKSSYASYTQLATLINQERAHNPGRTLLLNGGDDIQGDAMSYYFKSAPTGKASDGSDLNGKGLPTDPETSKIYNPMMAVLNAMHYDAMVLGNHEFNFGSEIFKAVLGQTNFPVLGANVADDGQYGLADANHGAGVQPYIEKTLDGIKVAIVGITNHRIPNYELPSNIPGLTFSNPIATAKTEVETVKAKDDVVIALTHIGFTTNPKSIEVDDNVDTNLAAQVDGVDAIIGAHSHTDPAAPETPYKFLPTFVASPDGTPVIINQAYRYNTMLGEVVLGVRKNESGAYEVVSRAGQYVKVATTGDVTPEDPAIKALVDPYVPVLKDYNNKQIGSTTTPLDALNAFTQETNAANMQADASLFELDKNNIKDVDFHISGAMTNKKVASLATPTSPVNLLISDMFSLMPYENSLVVLSMNGPQLKAVLERGYRNYYYYKYVAEYGGQSHYTTCMLDTNAGAQITYNDTSPALPNGNNVVSYTFTDKAGVKQTVDFSNATKFYNVSTVNYLAAGSCNFNDGGSTLWPLNQIVHDTQYYVRDAVIDYVSAQTQAISPAIENRLVFQKNGAANNAPVAVADTDTTNEDTAKTLAVLDNDTDVDGDTLTVASFGDGAKGKVSVSTDSKVLTYTPNKDVNGDDSFSYTVTDGLGGFATTTVTIHITAVNDAPVVTLPAIPVAKLGRPFTFQVTATDVDSTNLTYALGTNAPEGAAISNTGAFTWTPTALGTYKFDVIVSDDAGGITTTSVTVKVYIQYFFVIISKR